MADFAALVLNFLSGADYRPLTLKALARLLEIGPDDQAEFRAAVKELVHGGKLDLGKDRRLRRPDRAGLVLGTFRRSARGFGFVRPHSGAAHAEKIYIGPGSGRDAATGDEVAVKITRRPRRPGTSAEGRVVEVVDRASRGFVGTYYEAGGIGLARIDGTTFHDPIEVGDPGAKGARPGDKVALEMVRYPSPGLPGEGVITEVLGPRGAPGVDTLAIIRAFQIPDTFDDAALEAARDQARAFDESQIGDREDLRDVLTITIDPASARDFDDAISLSRDEDGTWSLGVHIADVAHFVAAGSAIDRAARERGTSVYLPDRVVPMLPEVLSNALASLQAGHTRYAVSAFLKFNEEGVLVSKRFARSAIRVDQRFTYEQAHSIMKAPDAPDPRVDAPTRGMLGRMLELAMVLRGRRVRRGALELNLPEVQVALGENGEVVGAALAAHDESHQVIEEFMLAANEAVAAELSARGALFLRRAHPDPEPNKLGEFAEFARGLGLKIERPQSRFELQRLLKETAGRPEEHAVHFGLLRSLKQANYTPEAEGHYALASENYCHFTSPIRRYPDLQVHRQLAACLAGKKPVGRHDELTVLAEHCTRAERRAELAEREVVRVKLLAYLEDHIGEAFHAVIVGVQEFGLFCRLVELPIEGLVHVTSLADDYYYLEAGTHTLVGRRSGRRFRLGDAAVVRIAHVDVDRRELDLVLDGPGHAPRPRSRSAAPPARPAAPKTQPKTKSEVKARKAKRKARAKSRAKPKSRPGKPRKSRP